MVRLKRVIFFIMVLIAFSAVNILADSYIIIDHTCLDVSKIPDAYITEIKKMWVTVPGESHSLAYRKGCQLLENENSRYQVNITESGTPEAYTDQYLRISRATWGDVSSAVNWQYSYGEEDWYTSASAVQRTKDGITYANTHDRIISAMGFGWCWDMTWTNNPGGTVDPVYQVHWAGSSVGGPEGDLRWGLDAGDQVLTSNSVCMDTYLNATDQYIAHCQTNGYATKFFFTTGPVDGYSGENGYQRHLKHEYMRSHVRTGGNRILFDYADILSWSNAGELNLQSWTDHGGTSRQYQMIHSDNMLDLGGTYAEDGDHIGERGALRLAKGLWWMLARMAGWPGPDISLAVQMDAMSAVCENGQGITVSWRTRSETGCAGFHVLRSTTETGTYSRITTAMILSQDGNSSKTHEYRFMDRNISAGESYWYIIEEISNDTQPVYHGPIQSTAEETLPKSFKLLCNYPNPFNGETVISYLLPEKSRVQIRIVNLNGRPVAVLADEVQQAGSQQIRWNGKDSGSSPVPSGIYFLVIKTDKDLARTKFTVVR